MRSEDVNTISPVLNRISRQKISKGIQDIKNTIKHLDQFDIYRTVFPPAIYAFFTTTHSTFTKVDHNLGH